MLILEIALGVLLGGILLSLLPLLIEFGGAILFAVVSIAILALIVVFLINSSSLLASVIAVGFSIYAITIYNKSRSGIEEIKELEKRILERKLLGYETLSEEEKLEQLKATSKVKKYKSEQERRKSLGYDN